nr:hypothetical protein BaRGS_010955 [Batillaria attramentaria]
MVGNYNNTLHLIVSVPESVTKVQHRNSRASNIFSAPLQPSSSPSPTHRGHRRSKSREDMLMAEIDDLYGYVRDGGVPPKSKFQYDSDEESYWEEPAYEPLDEFRARLKAIEAGQTVSFPPQYKPADPGQLKGLVAEGDGGPGGAAGGGGDGASVEGNYGVMATGPPDESSSSTATPEEPPPLPPRPSEMASAAAAVETSPATTTTATSTASSSRQSFPVALVQSSAGRRVSAPLPFPTTSQQSTTPTSPTQPTDTTPTGPPPTVPPRRVSRSDSVPTSDSFPTDSAAARPPPAQRLQQSKSTGDVKSDWKERLRMFNNMGDKEGSSSTSSGSAPGNKGSNRLARDFKDSDISSRAKTSSGSSGNARKRMQTLYL